MLGKTNKMQSAFDSLRKPALIAAFFATALLVLPVFAAETPASAETPPAENNFSTFDAILLGVVEGITEYLPVSSTGHLLFLQKMLGLAETEQAEAAADSYAIIIQSGAILAVLGLYFKRVRQVSVGMFTGDPGRQIGINLIIAFLPAAIVGLLLQSTIKSVLFGPWPIVVAWLAGGIVILAWKRHPDKKASPADTILETMTARQALIIGLIQCIAMWPGVSRSLATILGGLLVGLPLVAAVEFSFLLGGITLGAATVYELVVHGSIVLEAYDPATAFVGFLFSLISAAIAVKWLVTYLKTHSMAIFGYYRIGLAIAAAAYLLWVA
ncbi:Undecaprenyl-diphosphatase [Anaerohalosphaera lusitana]|uniref:Undecaprenyl-diphosphatase n=1 Tax=Anaerohalosphaera lusitana TaxID=1936003 RepID=A0A1U9NIP8_9BACT|nr:undecaprenyl-diphosphate phosphatase [Anaerohalosphaera lusitana]AQT67618.1 Undecaprenyl-diphosphatase [Anaerohalosphaera lusitana]